MARAFKYFDFLGKGAAVLIQSPRKEILEIVTYLTN